MTSQRHKSGDADRLGDPKRVWDRLSLGARWQSDRAGGFILMEIVVAIAILLLGMTIIGAQFQDSRSAAYETERFYRALLLAESKIAELDIGLIPPEEEIEEDFGRLFPDYAWRMRIEPTAIADLYLITLQILHDVRLDPDEPFDFDDAGVLYTVRTMRAAPARIDLTRDFGMSEEQADRLDDVFSAVGGLSSSSRDLDPGEILRDLPLEDLIELLPPLLQALGIDLGNVLAMIPAELQAEFETALEEALGPAEEETDEEETELEVTTEAEAATRAETPTEAQEPGAGETDRSDDCVGDECDEKTDRPVRPGRRSSGRRRR